ncbi:helix-turn-helix domain-containing protein [Gammaproteobacteria bacterium]|nr:helix-turn-helix domain-containing protein [Gammaproteobacteria bacterium]
MTEVYTVKELQQILKIGRKQAYEMIHDGTIFSVRIGSSIRIPKHAVDKFLGISSGTEED